MKILLVITGDLELKNRFKSFSEYVSKAFDTEGIEQYTCIKEADSFFIKVENRIKEIREASKIQAIDDRFYEENVKDTTLKNILMNGLYNSMELESIIDKNRVSLTDSAISFFKDIANSLNSEEYIFIWNTGEDNVDEILQSN